MSPKRLFRLVAVAEAITWTLLIAALVVRALTGVTLGVSIAGGLHGFVFLSYAATAVLLSVNQRWTPPVAALTIVAAVVPFATIPVELWLARSGRLAGPWRREATDDPRDRHWFDRLVRWFIRHPYLLVALIAVAVAVLFVVLLWLGPPPLPGKA